MVHLPLMFGNVWRLRHLLGWVLSVFRSREDLVPENLVLRQQTASSSMPRDVDLDLDSALQLYKGTWSRIRWSACPVFAVIVLVSTYS